MSFLQIFVLLAATLSFQSCTDKSKSSDTVLSADSIDIITDDLFIQKEGWKTLEDSLYSIQYPEDWEMNYTGQKGLNFVLVSPVENDEDMFRENLSLVIQSLEKDKSTLEEFAEYNTSQIVDMITNGQIEKNQEVQSNTINWREITYSGIQNDLNLKNTQRYTFHNGDAYVLTFTCAREHYDRFEERARELMNTFLFKN